MASFYVLQEVQNPLQSMGNSRLQDFQLPEPPTDLAPLSGHNADSPQTTASGANQEQLEHIVQSSLPILNDEQKAAFHQIIRAMVPGVSLQSILRGSNTGSSNAAAAASTSTATNTRVFFLDGPGGTGKTFLINVIQAFLELRNIKVIPFATSASAAGLLMGGRTAHSTFKIPIPALEDAKYTISSDSELANRLREASLIISDEVVMCPRFCIEAVNRMQRDLTGTNLSFGGKFVQFSGNFRQILPVVPGGSRAQIVNACIKSSYLFDYCKTLRLTENMRLKAPRNDPSADQEAFQFPDYLLQVGASAFTLFCRLRDDQLPDFSNF